MRLSCYDPATGKEIGHYTAISRAFEEERRARAAEPPPRLRARPFGDGRSVETEAAPK